MCEVMCPKVQRPRRPGGGKGGYSMPDEVQALWGRCFPVRVMSHIGTVHSSMTSRPVLVALLPPSYGVREPYFLFLDKRVNKFLELPYLWTCHICGG